MITSQPQSQTVPQGGSALFTVAVDSSTYVTYQWRFNGANIAGATSTNLYLANVQSSQAGNYNVNVTNSAGWATSTIATLTVLGPPVITSQPQSQTVTQGVNVLFSVAASGSPPLSYQWSWNGANLDAATNSTLQLINIQAWQIGNYSVVVSNDQGSIDSTDALLTVVVLPGAIVAWGNGDLGQTTVPKGLSNVLAISGGGEHSLALKAGGTVVAWGWNQFGQATVPAGVTNVAAIAGGESHNLTLKRDGTLAVWGNDTWGQTNMPPGLSNIVAIASGEFQSLALRDDGTVAAWGLDDHGQADVPVGLSNVVSLAGGGYHSLALRSDGTLVGWGDDFYGQTDVPPWLSNVVAIAAGTEHSLALASDGTVTAWGADYAGQVEVPPGLSNVVAIAAGRDHSLALRRDGTLMVWGDNSHGQLNVPPGLTNAAAIASRGDHSLAIAGNGAVVITVQPFSRRVYSGANVTFNVMAAGSAPLTYQWRLNGSNIPFATNKSYTRFNVQPAHAGAYSVVVGNAFGSVASSNALLTVIDTTVRLSGARMTSSGFQFQLTGPPGSYRFLASTDLLTWLPISTNATSPSGTLSYTDLSLSNFVRRFYRAQLQ